MEFRGEMINVDINYDYDIYKKTIQVILLQEWKRK